MLSLLWRHCNGYLLDEINISSWLCDDATEIIMIQIEWYQIEMSIFHSNQNTLVPRKVIAFYLFSYVTYLFVSHKVLSFAWNTLLNVLLNCKWCWISSSNICMRWLTRICTWFLRTIWKSCGYIFFISHNRFRIAQDNNLPATKKLASGRLSVFTGRIPHAMSPVRYHLENGSRLLFI